MTETIGRYEVKSELGRGGMATVFHAYDPQFKRDVAIKVLPRELLHDKEFRARFDREATIIAGLEHPGIVPVYDFGEQDGQPYLVMRYIANGSLKERIEQGAMSLEEVVRILNKVASALDYAHQKGVVHRDLKPDNILFDQHGEPYLTDFGIAKLAETGATLTGNAIVGTPAYMSPEQGRGDANLDGRSDIYSLGVIVFEMLTGRVPYDAATPMGLILKHMTEAIPNLITEKSNLPPDMQLVINQALAKRSYVRYATAGEFADVLGKVARGEPFSATRIDSAPTMSLDGKDLQRDGRIGTAPPNTQSVNTKDRTPSQRLRKETPSSSNIAIQQLSTPRKKRSPILAIIGIILLLGIVGGGYYLFANNLLPVQVAALFPSPIQVEVTSTHTPEPTITLTSIVTTKDPEVTSTSMIVETDSPDSTATSEITPTPDSTATEVPTPTRSYTPTGPTVGGADKIAFVSDKDIWISDMDGKNLERLTYSGGAKTGLQWSPYGDKVTYIAGRCVLSVDIFTKQIETILCMNWTDSMGGFEISPDGKYVAISSSYGLFILPYDLKAISTIRTKSQLDNIEHCNVYKNSAYLPMKAVRWSSDSKSVAVHATIVDLGRKFEQIVMLEVVPCNKPPVIMDQFPHKRFDDVMRGYFANPVIQDFAWDGDVLFALNVNTKNNYGELYTYNASSHTAELIDPLKKYCCYRSFRWSPNLEYFFFAFQDRNYNNPIEPYNVIFGTIGTDANYTPVGFDGEVLKDLVQDMQPAFRLVP